MLLSFPDWPKRMPNWYSLCNQIDSVHHNAHEANEWYLSIAVTTALPNKMDELTVQTHHQREYWECSIMLLTETVARCVARILADVGGQDKGEW